MVPKWLLIKGHVAHSSFKTIESESKNFYARNVDTRPLRTSLTFNQTTISTQTVMRAAEGLFVYNKTNFHYLPQNIAFDDFKSGKFATSGMSMILIDSVTTAF
jgi:hypothetical protein